MGDRALLLGGSGDLNLKVLYCLSRVAETHLAVSNEGNIAARSRHAATSTVVPFAQPGKADAALAQINAIVKRQRIDIVVPGDIGATAFLARHAAAVRAPIFPSSEDAVLQRIHNKWSFAQALMEAGLATPETRLIARAEDLDEALAAEIGFPLVVKPLECESSHGVAVVRDFETLRKRVESGAPYTSPPLVIQQFIPGEDIDISVLADRGRVVTSAVQLWSKEGDLVFCRNAEMEELAADIVALFGFHGVAHFDMRRHADTGGISVIECNPRFWYTLPASMWVGLNFVEAGIAAALGRNVSRFTPPTGRYRLPGDVVRVVNKPALLARMSGMNWRGMFQPLLDPMPHVASMIAKRRNAR